MDAEECSIAGLDYKVAVTRRIQQGLGIAHVSLTGIWETTLRPLCWTSANE